MALFGFAQNFVGHELCSLVDENISLLVHSERENPDRCKLE
uniref:Uncharacterized protein n=1 Tax=Anguilla anguilla TaxID=7936 RepID=A0A0E9QK88_ANGAN